MTNHAKFNENFPLGSEAKKIKVNALYLICVNKLSLEQFVISDRTKT